MNLKKAVRVETTSVFLDLIEKLNKEMRLYKIDSTKIDILYDFYARLCRTLHELAVEEDEVE